MANTTDSECSELYRGSGIGFALTEILDELKEANDIDEEQYEALLKIFDKEMRNMLTARNPNGTARNPNVKVLGDIRNFRHVYGLWGYWIRGLKLKIQGRSIRSKVDTKMVLPKAN